MAALKITALLAMEEIKMTEETSVAATETPIFMRQEESVKELQASAIELSKMAESLQKIIGDIKRDIAAGNNAMTNAARSALDKDNSKAA